MDCSACAEEPSLRVAWGCDADAPRPVVEIDCPRCLGRSKSCTRCDGRKHVPVFRCPVATVPSIYREVVWTCHEWDQGRLPYAGGVMDQPAWLVAAYRQVIPELVESREAVRKRNESKHGRH